MRTYYSLVVTEKTATRRRRRRMQDAVAAAEPESAALAALISRTFARTSQARMVKAGVQQEALAITDTRLEEEWNARSPTLKRGWLHARIHQDTE